MTHPRDDLSRLVRDVVSAPGETYERIAERSADPETGEGVSGSWLQKLAVGRVGRAPDLTALRALARGLPRPLAVVQRAAAAQFLAYEASDLSRYGDDVRIIVAHLAGMEDIEVRKWRRMVEAAGDDDDSGGA